MDAPPDSPSPYSFLGPPWDSDPETKRTRFLERFAGSYHSNWAALRVATAASFVEATQVYYQVVHAWKSGRESGQPRAETDSVLWLNYGTRLSGCLLGPIVLAAFALEAFTRLCAEIGLRAACNDMQVLRLALGGLEAKSFEDRVIEAAELVGAQAPPPGLSNEIKSLIEFRNSMAHDIPLLLTPTGHLLRTKRGRLSAVQGGSSFGGFYPLLFMDRMPLTFRHVRQAVSTHDAFVEHIQATSREIAAMFTRLAPGQGGLIPIRGEIVADLWTKSTWLVDVWETEIVPWVEAIPDEERENYQRGKLRGLHVRPVE